jgi:hypothetical protein
MGILFSFPDAPSCSNLFFFWFGRERERERDSSSIERELYNHEHTHTQCVGSFSFFVLAPEYRWPPSTIRVFANPPYRFCFSLSLSLSIFVFACCVFLERERGKD